MTNSLKFYFDFLSPYSYLAYQRVPDLAARYGFEIDFRVVDLDSLKVLVGNTGPATRNIPAKLKYARADMRRWAELYGVPLSPPAGYGSHRLNRGVFYAEDRDLLVDYIGLAWSKVWGEGGAMADEGLLCEVAAGLGWDAEQFLAYTVSLEAIDRYDRSTREALDAGIFGVPMMVLGDEMWWGNDRLAFVEEALARTNP